MASYRDPKARTEFLPATILLVLASGCGADPGEPPGEAPWEPPITISPAQPDAGRFERVVLVTIDTLRADHLASYGYFRETSPFLDRLAGEGVLFENALAAASHTAPSHVTMLTGLLPGDHGILQNGWTLDARMPTLASMYAALGYETAAITSVRFLGKIAASFQAVNATERDARETVDEAIRWLEEERSSDRYFLWVHLYDPHGWCIDASAVPKDLELKDPLPPDAYDEIARRHGYGDREGFDWSMAPAGLVEPESRDGVLAMIDDYDALISFADAQVERLNQVVSQLDLGPTLWVVTSDHGEGLGSHDYFGHGKYIYNEQLRVPLILAASDGSLGPRRIEPMVQHVDLLPTLAELAGASISDPRGMLEGTSLVPLLEGRAWNVSERIAFAQRRPTNARRQAIGWLDGEVYAVQSARLKYIHRSESEGELYDLVADPLELRPLELGEEGRDLRAYLGRILQRHEGREAVQEQKVSDEILEELRALGYMGADE